MVRRPPQPQAGAAELSLLRRAFGLDAPHEQLLSRLLASARRVRCGPGSLTIGSPCQPEPAWWLLHLGRIGIGEHAARGGFVERRCIGPGEWLDVSCALRGNSGWLDAAWCHRDVELLAIPVEAIVDACAGSTAFARAYGRVLATALHELHRQYADATCPDATGRLARWLLRMGVPFEGEVGPVQLRLSERKKAIAHQLHLTAETLSRTLRDLQDRGLIEVRGYDVTVRDAPALRRIANADPSGRQAALAAR